MVREKLNVSECRVCRLLDQPRSTQRRKAKTRSDERALRDRIIKLACQYGHYGYRRITALLRNQVWVVNHRRVERIWREEALKVTQKQPKRRRLWINDGFCIKTKGTLL